MKKNNLFLGAVMLGIALIYYMMIGKLPEEAALYPTFVALVLGFLSILFIIKTAISKEVEKEKKIFDGFEVKQFIFVFSMATFYIVLIQILGYFVSTFLFLIITLCGLKANKLYALCTSVGFSIFVLILFKILLNVPLPRGFIF
ncbi:tripartite tricarboxylate transporter TctB family protein [Crassaminicella indica]|uniref:Tripartite tricarboxylate transporter TctB family protein n=1 Tax=Crassaminicella indica TaxID=2855394 RepID=A0ABX8RH55_9CLOT|nr:tripartite tricarboxylate transporter TctB family protein [Crassaminicella indica]QXM07060.1 tripartite tricarboxylate transporter TctB family protein [Crassaminicella indica]